MSDFIKYIKTTSANLDDLPIVNGQLIALTDTDGLYYDLDNVRHVAGSGAGSITLEGLEDVDLSSLVDGQILQYDSATEKWINATVVETISSDDFDDLPQEEKDNGTAYFIPDAGWTGGGSGGGGGGTTVVANPEGAATDDLTKLQVGTTIYAVSGGGGSTYTAGDGIVIDNDEISVDEMPDTDMAEIVTPLPGTFSRRMKYSTTEQVVGEWIDGKPLYQKVVDFGALPNSTTKKVAHGISNLGELIFIMGTTRRTSSGSWVEPIPRVNTSSAGNQCSIQVDATDIAIISTINLASNYAGPTYIILQYTKTTDTANS